jgi:hypothetical protein
MSSLNDQNRDHIGLKWPAAIFLTAVLNYFFMKFLPTYPLAALDSFDIQMVDRIIERRRAMTLIVAGAVVVFDFLLVSWFTRKVLLPNISMLTKSLKLQISLLFLLILFFSASKLLLYFLALNGYWNGEITL